MMNDKKAYREVLGERLRAFREERGLTAYRVALNGGIRIEQVQKIERGEGYTIDVFLGYIAGCDLYMYFAPKSSERKTPHDFDDLVQKGIDNSPDL